MNFLRRLFSRRPIDNYFITGTGRCGTMLVANLLNIAPKTHCNHEFSISTHLMKEAYFTLQFDEVNAEVESKLATITKEYNAKGQSYGECSSHLYPVYPEVWRRFGERTRLALLVRRPDHFVASALSRGFFNPEHPHALEHVRPSPTTEVGARWETMSPFEKCIWYWGMVNGSTFAFLETLPEGMGRLQRMEEIDFEAARELYMFFHLEGFEERQEKIQETLGTRINASPGQGDERHLNPWSKEITMGDASTWNEEQWGHFEMHCGALARRLYPEADLPWMRRAVASAGE